LSATNHTASDPSHAGRDDDGHHHPVAIIVRPSSIGTIPLRARRALTYTALRRCCSRRKKRLFSAKCGRRCGARGGCTDGVYIELDQLVFRLKSRAAWSLGGEEFVHVSHARIHHACTEQSRGQALTGHDAVSLDDWFP
jgi:hypothetical protein